MSCRAPMPRHAPGGTPRSRARGRPWRHGRGPGTRAPRDAARRRRWQEPRPWPSPSQARWTLVLEVEDVHASQADIRVGQGPARTERIEHVARQLVLDPCHVLARLLPVRDRGGDGRRPPSRCPQPGARSEWPRRCSARRPDGSPARHMTRPMRTRSRARSSSSSTYGSARSRSSVASEKPWRSSASVAACEPDGHRLCRSVRPRRDAWPARRSARPAGQPRHRPPSSATLADAGRTMSS